MKFDALLALIGDEPMFESGLLLAGDVDGRDVRRQLSRWVSDGKLLQLRRGLYALAPPYRKVDPHPFLVANRLVRGSYVSLQSALAHHGLIPESVPVVTSVTTRRPGRFETPLGVFDYRHLQADLLNRYRRELVAVGQEALIATPEKALADLIYLHAGAERPEFLAELRLEGLSRIGTGPLREVFSRRPKLRRALGHLETLAHEESESKPL